MIQQDQIFTTIGVYQGNKVAMRKVETGKITLSKMNLLDLKIVSQLSEYSISNHFSLRVNKKSSIIINFLNCTKTHTNQHTQTPPTPYKSIY